MCATCGCGDDAKTTLLNLQTGVSSSIPPLEEYRTPGPHMHEHVHADGTRHVHEHENNHNHHHVHADGTRNSREHDHDHGHDHDHVRSRAGPSVSVHGATLELETRILAKNDALAARNRAWLSGREILALNLVSSPGAGKTTLLERTITVLGTELPIFVIEGDQATANDGERIRKAGAPVVQINTGAGCHLDAEMVRRGLAELKPSAGAVLFIENVGNLVCPALFDLGERAKVIIFSVTEGEDKPLKYPQMFQAAELVLLNKTDLLPHLDFSVEEALANVSRVNPRAGAIPVSAKTGEGMDAWMDWIRGHVQDTREAASP